MHGSQEVMSASAAGRMLDRLLLQQHIPVSEVLHALHDTGTACSLVRPLVGGYAQD